MLTTRQIGSRRAKQAGNAFEDKIEVVNRSSWYLIHLPPCGGRWVAKGKFVGQKQPFDFFGRHRETDTAIFFDAKSCANEYGINLGDKKIFEHHQIEALLGMRSNKTVSGVLIRSEHHGLFYWLPAQPGFNAYHAWDSPDLILLGKTPRLEGLIPTH